MHSRLNEVVEWAENYSEIVKTMFLIQHRFNELEASSSNDESINRIPHLPKEMYLKILGNIF